MIHALHSIPYGRLPGYFLMFGIRELDGNYPFWYSWDELEEWAKDLGVPTAPVLFKGIVKSETELREIIEDLANQPSSFGSIREGVVVRVADVFDDKHFSKCVAKWVRAEHVAAGDDHWAHKAIVKNKLAQ